MSVANSELALNAAFLQEIKEAETELPSSLLSVEDDLTQFNSSNDAARCCLGLQRASKTLERAFLLEEAYGFVELVTVRPQRMKNTISRTSLSGQTLSPQPIQDLLIDHRLLFAELLGLSDQVSEWTYCGFLCERIAEVRDRFQTFRERLDEHDLREERLIAVTSQRSCLV
jgi:hypothetical protein